MKTCKVYISGWSMKEKKKMLRICIGWEENELEVQEPLN
jgi:hypothetical protein